MRVADWREATGAQGGLEIGEWWIVVMEVAAGRVAAKFFVRSNHSERIAL